MGLFTAVVVSYDGGFGAHAAVYTSRGSEGGPALYDPAGDYAYSHGGGESDVVSGTDANLPGYIDYHMQADDSVAMYYFQTTQAEEEQIIKNALDLPYAPPGTCSKRTSTAIHGVGPFKSIDPTYFPGSLASQLSYLPSVWSFYYTK